MKNHVSQINRLLRIGALDVNTIISIIRAKSLFGL